LASQSKVQTEMSGHSSGLPTLALPSIRLYVGFNPNIEKIRKIILICCILKKS